MGGKKESMRHPSKVQKAEEEPGQLKVRKPGEKSVEMVTSQTLEGGQSISERPMHLE